MYHNRRITKKLEQYIPAAKIFEKFSQEAGIAFLDSSLINELCILQIRSFSVHS